MQTSSPPVITPNRSQSNPDDMITLPRPIQSVGMDLHDVSGTSTGQTLPRERRAPPGTHFCPTIWWVYPHFATIFILHPLLSTFSSTSFFPCSADHERDWPPCKVVFFGLATNALNVRNNNNNSSTLKRRPQTSVTAADLVWVCAPPRTIRKWLRRLAFWILRTRAQDPCSCCLIVRTKVDEKVDNSGWRIKIVAKCGYTHQIVGQKWVPGGALLSRGRVWPVDVPETSCKSMPTL